MEEARRAPVVVAVRVRPLSTSEVLSRSVEAWTYTENSIIERKESGTEGRRNDASEQQKKSLILVFDRVFSPAEDNHCVYRNVVQTQVQSFLRGRNCAFICCGGPGSGKTYTIFGSENSPGVAAMAIVEVFNHLSQRYKADESVLRLSVVEIRNEELRDLLEPSTALLTVGRDELNRPVIKGALREILLDEEHAFSLVQKAVTNRSSKDGAHSSHVLITLRLKIKRTDSFQVSSFIFADTLSMRKETISLKTKSKSTAVPAGGDRSLITLNRVISELNEGSNNVSYEGSTLTSLMSHTLGGDAATAFLCTVNPTNKSVDESRNTLTLALRARKIINSRSPAVRQSTQSMMSHVSTEVADLSEELDRLKNDPNESSTASDKISVLERKLQKLKSLQDPSVVNPPPQRAVKLTRGKLRSVRSLTREEAQTWINNVTTGAPLQIALPPPTATHSSPSNSPFISHRKATSLHTDNRLDNSADHQRRFSNPEAGAMNQPAGSHSESATTPVSTAGERPRSVSAVDTSASASLLESPIVGPLSSQQEGSEAGTPSIDNVSVNGTGSEIESRTFVDVNAKMTGILWKASQRELHLNRLLAESVSAVQLLQQDNDDLKKKLERTKKEHELEVLQLRNERDSTLSSIDRKNKGEVDVMKTRIQTLEDEKRAMLEKTQKTKRELDDQTIAYRQLRESMDHKDAELQMAYRSIESLKQDVEVKNAEVGRMHTFLQQADESKSAMLRQFLSLQESSKSHEEDAVSTRQELNSFHQQLEKLNHELQSRSELIQNMRAAEELLKLEVKTNENEVRQLRKTVDELNSELSRKNDQLVKLSDTESLKYIKHLKERLKVVQREFELNLGSLKNLSDDLENRKSSILSLQQQLKADKEMYLSRISTFETQLQTEDSQLRQQGEHIQVLSERVKEETKMKEKLQEQVAALKKEIRSRDAQFEKKLNQVKEELRERTKDATLLREYIRENENKPSVRLDPSQELVQRIVHCRNCLDAVIKAAELREDSSVQESAQTLRDNEALVSTIDSLRSALDSLTTAASPVAVTANREPAADSVHSPALLKQAAAASMRGRHKKHASMGRITTLKPV
eukprot:GILJ01009929.1.p1 GENE.GILJ01009929.1~~GILJ01009929.1.p1  ORF type:complete len:1099 (-),score=201.37 GILJ01009929.1:161-3430(-)